MVFRPAVIAQQAEPIVEIVDEKIDISVVIEIPRPRVIWFLPIYPDGNITSLRCRGYYS